MVLVALASVCFARLIAEPAALIVDGDVPSVDHANPGERRGVGNDATFSFLPHHMSIVRVIRQFGHVPMWDDRGFAGRPLAANPQAGLFYPPIWLVWWSGAPAALGWLTALHLIWGGIGMYVLVRSCQLGRWSATVAAAIYESSPFLLAHTFEGHYPHVWAACWYPWAFWAYSEHRSGRVRGRLFLPGILAAASLTGHPQEWFLLILALTAWAFFDMWQTWRTRGPRLGVVPLIGWLGVVLLSIGIAAVALAPELAVGPWLARNPDAPVGVEIPRRYHLWILNAWQLLSPTALGGPSDYFGADNYWETLLSIGLAPLVLAVVGALRHPDRRLVRGWLVLAGLSIWLACGRHLVLFAVAYLSVPGMSWFRVPARALFLANVAGAVLAGLGVETLQKSMSTSRDWRRLTRVFAGIVLVLLAGLSALAVMRPADGSSRTAVATVRVLGDGCFWLVLGGMTLLLLAGSLARGPGARRWAGGLLGLLVLAELGWYGFALLHVAPAERFLADDAVGPALIRIDRDLHRSGRIRIKARDSFYTDLQAACLGIEKTNINDVFQLEDAARLYRLLYPVASFQRRRLDGPMQDVVDDHRRQIRQAVFDRLSVGYLVSNRRESDPGWPVVAHGAGCEPNWVIERNPTALPRAYVVPTATVTGENEAFTLARFREVDPRQTVFMNLDPLRELPGGLRQPFTAAEWASVEPDHPVLEVTIEAPGLLVISDTWMPGWTARVDGATTPIYQGNLAQRVIPLLRAGCHRVALDYQAPGLAPGLIVTALSILTWGIVVIRSLARDSELLREEINS
jgi:hypothetical protein